MGNIEMAWAVTSYVSIILTMILTGMCFVCFVRPYLRWDRSAFLTGFVYVAVMFVLYMIPFSVNNFAAYLCGVLAAFLAMLFCERENAGQKLFLAGTFFSLRWFCTAIAGEVDYLLWRNFVDTKEMAVHMQRQYAGYVVTKVIDLALIFLLLMATVFLVNRSYIYKKEKPDGKGLMMLLTPSVCGMAGYAILQFYMEIYERDTGKNLSGAYGIYAGMAVIYYLVSVASILVTVILFQNLKEKQKEQEEELFLQSQLDSMRKHIGEVERLQADVRMLRHDMGNHLQTMQTLLERGEKMQAAAYMGSLQKTWRETAAEMKSGHPVTDTILTEKKNRAGQKNIAFVCDFHYPKTGKADAFDLSIILNNALDNCLEHISGENPYIHLRSYCRESVFLI